ncbi:MAG: oligosaccharide flippase family protein [Oryzihumus sp.]
MTWRQWLRGGEGRTDEPLGRRAAASNLVAQSMALVLAAVASLVVARVAGPAVLGAWTLLRILPWLTAVIVSSGLPVATAYALSGPQGHDPRTRGTLGMLLLLGTGAASVVWLALTPALHSLLLSSVPIHLLVLMVVAVGTQLWTAWAKACCQGVADVPGANLIIVSEELGFLPAFVVAVVAGLPNSYAMVVGLIAAGACSTSIALLRLRRNRFQRDWGPPSAAVARTVLTYGARAQLGNLLWLVNLRLDVLMLGALAGPATLGVYAVASKSAELMRLPANATNYVLYPRFTRMEPLAAAVEVRTLLPRACGLTVLATPVVAAVSVVALPLLFGPDFRSAVGPACVLLLGLSVEGAAAVSSAYLCGRGRPGSNSLGMGLGVTVTLVLDLALIPRYGAMGAAAASSAAYLATTFLLTVLTLRHSGGLGPAVVPAPAHALEEDR